MPTPSFQRARLVQQITGAGVIAVIRAPSAEIVQPLAEALLAGGVIALEVTTSTPDFAAAIRAARERYGSRACVGAGTLLNAAKAEEAVGAGAQFLVSPISDFSLIEVAHGAGVPVMLGAFTPTEAQRVHEAGADFVKLFPADSLGLSFIRALRAPLPHLRLVPTGGVDARNAAEFRRAGCAAIGVGSGLIRPEWLAQSNWPALTEAAAAVVSAWRSA
ncbi:MAG TPA: bifunctional 4-hydroxy-2-oxoglutarate aldolase/2-dehydro-3-deoxy-phosphogluconate aldolase [Verrucomicrobiota bacterium]|nr:2-dehydro-3-deoxyphosphogluconate aldolase [Verrucomicrobiales bacterium]HRI14502.1 bifunctional 4-hydroxy-2-oxoglutarate aldolase/2-dehydro-3-deoxy-phosphogluconate aldolase [Verrucomicrobiota bacterium]